MAGSRLCDPTKIALPAGEGPLGAWSALPDFAGNHDDAVGVIAWASVRECHLSWPGYAMPGTMDRIGLLGGVADKSL
jgi:hypothetical protein